MTATERAAPAVPRAASAPSASAGRKGRQRSTPAYRHPVNQAVFGAAPFGARLADGVTGFMGSWRFIAIQTGIVAIWLAANIVLLTRPFDPFPFILLNLAFSTQAAYAAPLILLAGNRAAQRDRLTLEHAADEGDVGDEQNERLLSGNTEILTRVAALEACILEMERAILDALVSRGSAANAAPAAAASATPTPEQHERQDALGFGKAG
jgi:uncharacterized membrane protein